MNFVERIRNDIIDLRRQSGMMRDSVIVNRDALMLLLRDYDRIDSDLRSIINEKAHASIEQRLCEIITACYHDQEKDSDLVIMLIMNTLLPLMKQKIEGKYQHLNPRRK